MKYQNINIKGTGIYHPTNRLSNEYFIKHFNQLEVEVEGLLTHLERNYRYHSDDPKETVITMAYNASINALKNSNINVDEIDIVVFATDTPEYTSPSNAIKLVHMIEATNAKMVYDTNSNCIGMLSAMDQVSRILKTHKKFKKALVVGSLLISSVVSKNDSVTYPNFGDLSAAMILEKEEEDIERGFIDSVYYTKTTEHDNILMPKIGYSRTIRDCILDEEDKKWFWDPFDSDFLSDYWMRIIEEVTYDNNISPREIDHYVFSQFSNPSSKETLSKLNVDNSRMVYVGDEYGYTGVTSPILALHKKLESGIIKDGDSCVFCSVGSGSTTVSILYKF
ncbi:3-oxoacyl-[acyl-carrier-protein] synthase III [Gottschalkia acidurici 9a]|uniref:3-oxoacyl-[acyl-carrier-protein] synthase III n=1 Tax=Gottschalkia acidurici (strain ATCC 7906 / DSM 604 / BCRC 14475 / CIP 104303 / KCTC 5404 / NCIMB 10678 / 9a) TaxID=1128398 RepID=K0B1W5_GOTA9|nr:ketoacyl-ACP synthase III [Gottschalkia acidurici]AFS79454.1 3-oxoacyl-[acyl-carrier-protein] synthase III [Gottschalkia acidurici 9a]